MLSAWNNSKKMSSPKPRNLRKPISSVRTSFYTFSSIHFRSRPKTTQKREKMNCCRPRTPKETPLQEPNKQILQPKNVKRKILLTLPNCKVHLMDEGEALELAKGDLEIIRLSDESVILATVLKVGDDLQWPLTRDEPIIKLDAFHYLFSLPIKDGEALSYGVTFSDGGKLGNLDSFLRENSCFSCSVPSSQNSNLDWKEFAPAVENYNNFLAKAIAGGTGQVVKGIFMCSNAYTNQIQKGGEMIVTQTAEQKKSISTRSRSKSTSGVNKSLKRVRKVSKMTEKMSKSMLEGVGLVTGSVMRPMVRSQAGKSFLNMIPGEILLASLDALNKVLDAAEAAEKQAFSATSAATTRMVTNRYGESAGEATEDALATAGHCVGTAWNVFKIRKAVNPASSVSSGVLTNVRKTTKP